MAVYTDVSFEDLTKFLAGYDIGEPRVFKGIAEGVENSNYYLLTAQGRFIVTLYERRVQAADLPFFLGLMQHLAEHGVDCPTPIRGKNGELFGTLNGRDAAVMTFLDGVSLGRPRPEHCFAAGRALGTMHEAGRDFPLERANALSVEGWRRLTDDCFRNRTHEFSDLAPAIQGEMRYLESRWPAELPRGVVHADLFPDNVLFMSNQVSGLIDFYFACNDALAYDLAVMINAWCFDIDNRLDLELSGALIAGYQGLRDLEPSEREALPILARGAALRFTLTRLYDWIHPSPTALVSPKDPREFAARIAVHQSVDNAEAYGL
jgi:homoserine kinase type II